MIALKTDSFNLGDTFHYSEIIVKTGSDVLKGDDLPDFYEIKVKWKDKPLSIIGVRIKVDITKSKQNYKENQFRALDGYLSKQTHNIICVGDYNAFWGNSWATTNNTTLPETAKKGYLLYTPQYNKQSIESCSYVMPDNNENPVKLQLDHLITNINNKEITVTVKYDWSFISSRHEDYNNKKAESANKPKGMPDHAILKAIIQDDEGNET